MIVKGKDKKIATAYIKARYPIGSIIEDPQRSGCFEIKNNSVFEVISDSDQVAEFDPKHEFYTFTVRSPGCDVNYYIRATPKNWVFDYYETKILKLKNNVTQKKTKS
jgi:hypothetical protein